MGAIASNSTLPISRLLLLICIVLCYTVRLHRNTVQHKFLCIAYSCKFHKILFNHLCDLPLFTIVYWTSQKNLWLKDCLKNFVLYRNNSATKCQKMFWQDMAIFHQKKKNEKLAQTQLHTVRPLVWKISRFLYYQKYNNTYYIPIVAVVFL